MWTSDIIKDLDNVWEDPNVEEVCKLIAYGVRGSKTLA
jgi:hypothetical protein